MGLADGFRPEFLANGPLVPGLYPRQAEDTGNLP